MTHLEMKNEDHRVLLALFAAGGSKKSKQNTMVLIFHFEMSHYYSLVFRGQTRYSKAEGFRLFSLKKEVLIKHVAQLRYGEHHVG